MQKSHVSLISFEFLRWLQMIFFFVYLFLVLNIFISSFLEIPYKFNHPYTVSDSQQQQKW